MSSSEAENGVLWRRVALLQGLLTEAREHVTDKPWDDRTLLHKRISEALGLPVEYADWIREAYGEDEDGPKF